MKQIYDPEFLGLQVAKVFGKEALVFCPYHDDTHPSAEFNLEKGLFYCFGCQTSKTAKQLAEDLGGTLIPLAEIPEEYKKKDAVDSSWIMLMRNPLAIYSTYLLEREVNLTQIRTHGIRENDDGIIFPIYDLKGQQVGAQIRHLKRKPKYMFYGSRTPVWPMGHLFQPGRIFITEGVFGVLRGEESGSNVVAMMGAGIVSHTADFFNKFGGHEPMAVMDNDYAGLLAAGKFVLKGIPAIIAPWRGEPDEWSVGQWDETRRHAKDYATWDVNDIIDESEEPQRLQKTLEKFWRKL